MSLARASVRRQPGTAYLRLPEYLDDYVAEDNPVRVIRVFVDELDLGRCYWRIVRLPPERLISRHAPTASVRFRAVTWPSVGSIGRNPANSSAALR